MTINTYTLTELVADEGKILTNGTEYAEVIYLGDNDKVENWQEVDKSQMPQDEEGDE